jgi:hypothetical protein
MSDHATIKVGGYSIPLIGIPTDACLQECDLCHDEFGLLQVEWSGVQMLCHRCRAPIADSRLSIIARAISPVPKSCGSSGLGA